MEPRDLTDGERDHWSHALRALAAAEDEHRLATWLELDVPPDIRPALVGLAATVVPRLEGQLLALCLSHGCLAEVLTRQDLSSKARDMVAEKLLDHLSQWTEDLYWDEYRRRQELLLAAAAETQVLHRDRPAVAAFLARVVVDASTSRHDRSLDRWGTDPGWILTYIPDATPGELQAAMQLANYRARTVVRAVTHPQASRELWEAALIYVTQHRPYTETVTVYLALAEEPRVLRTPDVLTLLRDRARGGLAAEDEIEIEARLALADPPAGFADTFRRVAPWAPRAATLMLGRGTDAQLGALRPEDLGSLLVAGDEVVRHGAVRALGRMGMAPATGGPDLDACDSAPA